MAKVSKAPTAPVEEVTLTAEQIARLKAQSGTAGGGSKLPVLSRISLNGNADAVEDAKGNLTRPTISYRKQIFVGKDSKERPEMIVLGSPIEVIFVKSRRRLVARDSQGFQTMSTSQHSSSASIVTLWENGKVIDSGAAKDLRVKYEGLRTVQETYVLLPDGELALLISKGAALGSKTRDEKLPNFYDYLQLLSKAGGMFAYKTILGGILEKGAKNFYTMTFEIGRPTTTAEQLAVLEHSDALTALMAEYDAENAKVAPVAEVVEATETNEEPF